MQLLSAVATLPTPQVIITTDTTIVLNAENDKVHPFVLDLQQRLSTSGMGDGEGEFLDKRAAALECLDTDTSRDLPYELKVRPGRARRSGHARAQPQLHATRRSTLNRQPLTLRCWRCAWTPSRRTWPRW